MKDFKRDILQEASLKNSPYSVPEGYFESLKERAVKYSKPAEIAPMQFRRILWTAISMAAMFIIMVTAGTMFLKGVTPEDDLTQEDYIVFSDGYFDLEMYDTDGMAEQYADASISDEDIIEYLIYTGVSQEFIEMSK